MAGDDKTGQDSIKTEEKMVQEKVNSALDLDTLEYRPMEKPCCLLLEFRRK